ncbi:MAG: outer membrane beta-barrel protein, partial [Bradyrhizobium sp.]|uniref:outer membrane protein n=1 Tax=Bradyrhizobium sp. TaxID=376 RepID=UPI00238F8C09
MSRYSRTAKCAFAGVGLVMLTLANAAGAADLPLTAPAVPDAVFNWTGFYVGGHFGYAAGRADWSATDVGTAGRASSGSFDLFNAYDASKGTGSYFAGLQAGYNYVLPSHWLIGFEADISAPNTLAGSQTVSTPLDGQATYTDTVLQFGTARARLGYAFDRWLVYGTGGLAWTYDRLERTQLAGGNIGLGTTEAALLWRWGWTAGAGVEFPVAPGWTAKVEYLVTGFGAGRKLFPAAGQSLDSDLSMQSLRVGLNYQLGGDLAKSDVFTKGVQPLDASDFAVHGQATFVEQYAAPFRAPYAGQNSLAPNAGRETFDLDLYVGYRPWKGAEIWVNPEIDQGFGLSDTFGVAGFPSAEAYKVGQAYPYARIPRAFLRQTI